MKRNNFRKFEQYQDRIARLYPELVSNRDNSNSIQRSLSRTVTFQVTDKCNLACKYCYQINKSTRRMSIETAKKFVDYLLSADETNTYINPTISPAIVIEFIGGEPFLEIKLISQICEYFERRAIELQHPWAKMHIFSICSNGILYDTPEVKAFLNKYADRLSFSVTIDGNKELHDSCRVFPDGSPSYDIAIKAVKDWVGRGNYMGSKITIAPGNLEHLYTAITHMIDLGYEEINANVVYEKGWEQHHSTEYYWQLKKVADYFIDNDLVEDIYCALFEPDFFRPKDETDIDNWCGGLGLMLSCDPDGYLYPCIRYMESSLGNDIPPIRIGHVDTGIGSQQCERDCINCFNCINRRTQSTDECFYCPIAEGCSWCFKAGTLISTPNGLMPIEEIKIGDKVLSGSGNVQAVSNINERYTDDTISIKASGTPEIFTTKEHPFFVKKLKHYNTHGLHGIYDEPQWIEAKDIKKSDRIGLLIPMLGNNHIDENVAYLAGRFVGDGWKVETTRKTPTYYLCCDYKECEELEQYFDKAKISYNKDNSVRTAQQYCIHSTNHEVNNNNELLIRIISEAGKYAHGKKVPCEVFTWDKESVQHFLKGYSDADGYHDEKRNIIRFTTVSKELAEGISSLLRVFGKKTGWSIKSNQSDLIEGRKVNLHTAYELTIPLHTPKRKWYEIDEENHIMWVNVRDVKEQEGYNVYNMTVENEHTFIADGAIVHNCSAYNYQEFGTADHRATYICEMHKARALANAYYYALYSNKTGKPNPHRLHVPDEWALKIIPLDEWEMIKDLYKEYDKEEYKNVDYKVK